jgi:DNA primase
LANNKGLPDFSKIKETIGFEDVLKRYGLLDSLRRKGDQLTGACPIHKGDGKSCFSVNLAKGCFNCFSCKAHGNFLDFVAVMENISLKEAGLLLSDWVDVPLALGRIQRQGGQAAHPPLSSKAELRAGKLVREEKEQTGSLEPINPPLIF